MQSAHSIFVRIQTLIFSIILVAPMLSFAQSTTTASTTASSTLGSSTPAVETVLLPPPVVDTRQPLLQPIAQSRITNLAANLSNRLDASTRRLTNITVRLDSRIAKMSTEGIDVRAAQLALQDAQVRVTAAQNSLATIDAEVAAFVGASDPLTAWVRLEAIYGTIRENVVAAHAALRECLRLLENASPLVGVPEATAPTSTPQ